MFTVMLVVGILIYGLGAIGALIGQVYFEIGYWHSLYSGESYYTKPDKIYTTFAILEEIPLIFVRTIFWPLWLAFCL